MKRHYIQYIFVSLLGFASPCIIYGAAGLGAKMTKGAANIAQEIAASAGCSASATIAAQALRDKNIQMPGVSTSAAKITPKTPFAHSNFNKAFGNASTAAFTRSSIASAQQGQLGKSNAAGRTRIQQKKAPIFRVFDTLVRIRKSIDLSV